uniref:MARVEL domain-containing protein n=1 Tax=Trichuris muris TaxID=70415 RepID=A0A5S6R512_TRIMR
MQSTTTSNVVLLGRSIRCTHQLALQWVFACGTLTAALLISLSVFVTPWITFAEAQVEVEVGLFKACGRIFNQTNCTSQWQNLAGGDLIGAIMLVCSVVVQLFSFAWFVAITARCPCTSKLRCSLITVAISATSAFVLSLIGLAFIASHRFTKAPGLNLLRAIIDPDMISHHSGPSVVLAMMGVWWTFLNSVISCSILQVRTRMRNHT